MPDSSPTPDTPPARTFPLCFFSALCLFLSAVEYAVPKPLPFLRLGLANVPVMVAVKRFRVRDVLALLAMKVLAQALVGGTLFSYIFVFSMAGSLASGAGMILAWRLLGRRMLVSNVGLSLAGAMANTAAQLACARWLLFGGNTAYIVPLLAASAVVTGAALGLFTNRFEQKSRWISALCGKTGECGTPCRISNSLSTAENSGKNSVEKQWKLDAASVLRVLPALASLVALPFIPNLYVLWTLVLLLTVAGVVRGRGRVRLLPPVLVVLSVTFMQLLSPYGRVLAVLGGWRITAGALAMGLRRSGVLVGMVAASRLALGADVRLPSRAGRYAAAVLDVFARLTARRIQFRPGHVIEALDERLLEAWRGAAR